MHFPLTLNLLEPGARDVLDHDVAFCFVDEVCGCFEIHPCVDGVEIRRIFVREDLSPLVSFVE